MKLQTNILSEAEQERIHQQSLRILQEVGVRYHGGKSLPLLAQHGARIDWQEKIAFIPPELVEHCLATAPRSFVLGARNPAFDFILPAGESRYCIDGTAAFALDFKSGERRYGTHQDIEDALRIFQQMDLGVMAWAPTCASDAPAHSRALHEFFAMIAACSKHGQHELHSIAQVPYLMAGLEAIEGSAEAVKARKNYSLIYCPVAPLSHDGEMLDAYLELGELDMPISTMPMPICGTTGPASLFSNISLANAENLSALVVFQLGHPGRPVIFSNATGTLDFLSGAYLGGVPEMGLMSAGLTVMGRYYGLPSTAAGCTADAKQPGPQAILEKFLTTLPSVLMGVDLVIGTGEVEGDQLLVLEQLVVDNEIGHLCQRLAQGIDCGEEKDLFDDISQVGPGGHFLKSRNTRQAARNGEFFISRLLPRGSYESWLDAGRPTIYSRAREKVTEILEGPQFDPLPDEVIGKLDEILRTADRELLEA
jgi:trimethylamine--corrinoid protein Co-methyltransferase